MSKLKKISDKKSISLALQGGGAHGAFTWGVLDRLLELDAFNIRGISGTSAGAMNAAVLISGYMDGGNEGARENLAKFWKMIGNMNPVSYMPHFPFENGNPFVWNLHWSPVYNFLDIMTRYYSPYEFNPMNFNPLRQVLSACVNTDNLKSCSMIRLFVSATSVSQGTARVFECHEITEDVLLASACLPFMYQAVEVEGEHYWDGGYMGNPMLEPLMPTCRDGDLLIVQINPLRRAALPTDARNIIDRLNEITFNSSLLAEIKQIQFINDLLSEVNYKKSKYKPVRLHMINLHEEMLGLDASSKLNANYHFFEYLRDLGRETADEWLEKNYASIGSESTMNMAETFKAKKARAA